MLCFIGIHQWEWIKVREGLPGMCVERMRCSRCLHVPAYPFDDYVLCRSSGGDSARG